MSKENKEGGREGQEGGKRTSHYWLKHNAVLKDLIEQPWPIVYQFEGRDVPLVYYVAFYLPAAFLGKLGGWSLANQALFAWSLIGQKSTTPERSCRCRRAAK